MVDPELLEILVCPETKTPVRLADEALMGRVNGAISRGALITRGGTRITERLEAGLVRKDGKLMYPIRDGIPVMLIDEAVPLDSLSPEG